MDTRSRKGSASTKDISLFDLPDVNKSLFIMNDVFDREVESDDVEVVEALTTDVETAGDRASGSSTPVVIPIHEISPPLSPDPNPGDDIRSPTPEMDYDDDPFEPAPVPELSANEVKDSPPPTPSPAPTPPPALTSIPPHPAPTLPPHPAHDSAANDGELSVDHATVVPKREVLRNSVAEDDDDDDLGTMIVSEDEPDYTPTQGREQHAVKMEVSEIPLPDDAGTMIMSEDEPDYTPTQGADQHAVKMEVSEIPLPDDAAIPKRVDVAAIIPASADNSPVKPEPLVTIPLTRQVTNDDVGPASPLSLQMAGYRSLGGNPSLNLPQSTNPVRKTPLMPPPPSVFSQNTMLSNGAAHEAEGSLADVSSAGESTASSSQFDFKPTQAETTFTSSRSSSHERKTTSAPNESRATFATSASRPTTSSGTSASNVRPSTSRTSASTASPDRRVTSNRDSYDASPPIDFPSTTPARSSLSSRASADSSTRPSRSSAPSSYPRRHSRSR